MKLEPFVKVDEMPFSASGDDVLAMRGEPEKTSRNEVGLIEFDYGNVVYRFQDCGRLEEITMQAPIVNFSKIAVPFSALGSFIQSQDPATFERAGFLVSPRFGLAFDPNDPSWVTALAEHCIDTWRAI